MWNSTPTPDPSAQPPPQQNNAPPQNRAPPSTPRQAPPQQRSGRGGGSADINYNNLKSAIEDEKALLQYMTDLGPEKFSQLMQVSQTYAQSLVQQRQHERDLQMSKEREARENAKSKVEEEITKQKRLDSDEDRKRRDAEREDEIRREKALLEHKKQVIDYQTKKNTEEEKERTRIRTEEKLRLSRIEEDRLQKEDEYREKEALRKRELIDYKLKQQLELKQEDELKMADFRFQQEMKRFEATKEDQLKSQIKLKELDVSAKLEKAKIRWNSLTNFFTGDEGKDRMLNIGYLVGGSIAVWYVFATVRPIAVRGLSNYFFKPVLVGKYNHVGFLKYNFPAVFSNKKNIPKVVAPRIQDKLDGFVNSIKNTSKRGGYFPNMLLYGKPGTGKTLYAERLARESNMDFAVMSGPSFDQFSPPDAIMEIKNLFKWAKKSRRGMILFVDEADSFLEDRVSLSPERVRVLNEWLNQTGTESKKVMCVYETNRPEVLDPAVQSRLTYSIEFPTPTRKELQMMLEQYIDLYIMKDLKLTTPLKKSKEKIVEQKKEGEEIHLEPHVKHDFVKAHGKVKENELHEVELELPEIAEKLEKEEFVGRDVTNLVIAISQGLSSSSNYELTKELVDSVVEEQIAKKRREKKYLEDRYKRLAGRVPVVYGNMGMDKGSKDASYSAPL